jgi:hypothetical protein
VDKLSPTELKFFAAEASVASFWNGLDFLGKGNFIRAEQLLAEAELYQSMNGTRADPQCYLPVLRKLINRRRQMGNIHPTAVMKIGLVHIMRARIDGELREIRAAQIKHTSIEWNIIKCFVEVHSGGKLSLTVDSFMHDGEYTAFVPNTHVPEISSVKPYPVLLYYKLSHGYDFFITYHPWNAEYSTALGSIDIVPKRWSKTVNNAELTLSAPLSIEEESPGRSCSHLIFSLPLHEWAHTIEWSYGQTNGPLYGHPWTSTDNPYSRDPHPAPIYPWTSQTNPFNTEQWPEMKYYETLYSILLPKIFRERKISWSSLLSARRPETPDDEFFEYLDFQHAWNPSPDVRLKIVCGMADKDGNPDTTVVRTAGFDCQRAEGLREIRWSLSKSAWTAATDWWGEIRFQIKVPPKTSGRLRLFFRDPTNALWQEIFINENKFKSAIKLSEQGQWVDMPYRPDSNADGIFKVRITSTIQSSPLLSGVEVIETK